MQTHDFPRRAALPGRALFLAGALVLVLGCEGRNQDEAVNENRAHVIQDVPAMPGATQIDTTGAPDAERSTWRLSFPMAPIADFYRRELPKRGYVLQSDRSDSNVTDLYAKKGERDIWMHFERKAPGLTEWTVIASAAGELPDSVKKSRPLR